MFYCSKILLRCKQYGTVLNIRAVQLFQQPFSLSALRTGYNSSMGHTSIVCLRVKKYAFVRFRL